MAYVRLKDVFQIARAIDDGRLSYSDLDNDTQNALRRINYNPDFSTRYKSVTEPSEPEWFSSTVSGISKKNEIMDNVDPNFAANHPTINKILETISSPIRSVMSNPFMERAGQTGANVMTMVDRPKVSTGSSAKDFAADIIGSLMGFTANPGSLSNVGGAMNLGGTIVSGADDLASRLLPLASSKVSSLAANRLPAATKIASKVAPVANKLASSQVANLALRGAAQSIPYDIAYGLANKGNVSTRDVVSNALAGAGMNLLPYGIGKALAKRKGTVLDDAVSKAAEPVKTKTDEILEELVSKKVEPKKKIGVEIPIDERTYENVTSKKVNAYQYDHPEVKPYIQSEATRLLGELSDSVKGERFLTHDRDGNLNVTGTKRLLSDALARVKDETNSTYDEIRTALQRIVDDKGAENVSLAKKLELTIDDNLTYGTKDITGLKLPANEEYVGIKSRLSGKTEAAATTSEKPFGIDTLWEKVQQGETKGDARLQVGDILYRSGKLTDKEQFGEVVSLVDEIKALRKNGTLDKDGFQKALLDLTESFEPRKVDVPDVAPGGMVAESVETPVPDNEGLLGVGSISAGKLQLPDTLDTITSKTDKGPLLERIAPVNVVNTLKKAYYKTIDGYNRLNDVDKLYQKSTGRSLPTNEKTFILAHNTSNAETIAQRVLMDGMVDAEGNVVGSSLKDIVQQVPKGQWKKLEDYLKLKHYKAWEAADQEVYSKDINMTPYIADKKIQKYESENPWMATVAKQYTDWISQFTETWLVKTGMLSEDAFSAMKAKYGDYIPMQRLMDDVEIGVSRGGAKRSFVDQPSPVKAAKGSERKTIESLETLLEKVPSYIKSAKRNEVSQRLADLMAKAPDEMKAFGELVDPNTTKLDKNNIVAARIDGERVHIKINDLPLLEALTTLSPQAQNIVVNAARSITGKMKLLTTGINPIFSLGRNAIRDIPMSYIASKTTNSPVTWARDLVGAVVDMVGNRENFKLYKQVGGGHATAVSADVDLMSSSKAKLMPGYYNLSNIKNPVEYTKRLLNVPFTALEKLADLTETAPRLGEFRRIIRQEGNTPAARQKALYESKDITVDFSRSRTAEVTYFLDAFVPYWGAACQGLGKLTRTFLTGNKKDVAGAWTKAFAAVTIPTLLLYVRNKDNPEYQKVSQWTKDTNFLVPLEDGTFLKLPKPREAGVVFGALVERTLRQMNDQDPKAFDDFSKTILSSFTPPLPWKANIASPIITNIPSNKDFAGRSIVPGYMEGLSPELQYDAKTSSIAKKLGAVTNYSPKKIDYLMNSYLGVIAQVGIPATSEKSAKDVIERMFTVDPAYSQDTVRNFYDRKTEIDTKYNDSKATGGALSGNDEKYRKLYNKIADVMSDTNKTMRSIENDKTLTPEAKQDKLRAMQLALVDMANIASKSEVEQMGMYNTLKKKGLIVEEKPKTATQKATEKRNEDKKRKEMTNLLTR